MKIIRYQSGGIYYTPFFGDEAQTSKSSSSSSSSEDKEEQMIKKEIISILKMDKFFLVIVGIVVQ